MRTQARIGIHLEPDIPRLLDHFARSIADEIRAREVTRFILPVGPMGQYPRLAEITNRERISWRNVHVFQMDEFLDWQGRPIPLDHPLSFEGAMRRFFASIDPELRIRTRNTMCLTRSGSTRSARRSRGPAVWMCVTAGSAITGTWRSTSRRYPDGRR